MSAPFAAVTVVSANYLAYTRTMFESLARYHPEARCLALLADRAEDRIRPGEESFDTLSLEDLKIPDLRRFLFRHTSWERPMALKPLAIRAALDRFSDIQKILYLDSDLFFLNGAGAALEQLESAEWLLTPQIVAPVPDRQIFNELLFLRTGTFNMGFLGIRRGEESRKLLEWWREKLGWGCLVDLQDGLFVDQKWMNFAPALSNTVAIFRNPGYNAARWNLSERDITRDAEGTWRAAGQPLVFFHFSGYAPPMGESLCTADDIVTPEALKPLVQAYRERLLAHGWETCRSWKCAFERYDDGAPVHALDHMYYRDVLQYRMAKDRDPYKGLPFSPALALLKHLARDPLHARSSLAYSNWISLLRRWGLAPHLGQVAAD